MTTETTTTPEKTRNTKSWKTEATNLEAMLVAACTELCLVVMADDGTETRHIPRIANIPEVDAWWEDYRDSRDETAAKLRASALSKLTKAELKALNLSPPPADAKEPEEG